MNAAAQKPAETTQRSMTDIDATWRQLEARREEREARAAARRAREERYRTMWF